MADLKLGLYATNYMSTFDTEIFLLAETKKQYPQKNVHGGKT